MVLSFSVILWLGGAALIALTMEWNNSRQHGRALCARQADGGAVPVGIHPYRGHEHRGPGGLRHP